MLAKRRGRPWHASPRPHSHPEFVDEAFDDGADETIALLRYEIDTYGAAPLHPDGDRITTYDPVPIVGGDDRERYDPRPALAEERERKRYERRLVRQRQWKPPPPPDQIVAWLEKPPAERQRLLDTPPTNEQFVAWLTDLRIEWLPGNFQWLIGEEQWISQAEVEAFWIARRTRSAPWIGWGATRQVKPPPIKQERL